MTTSLKWLFVFLLCATRVLATAQSSDLLVLAGKEHWMHSNPLEAYFAKNPAKRPASKVQSSDLWRGYVATFEITEGELRVKDIQIRSVVSPEGVKKFETALVSVVDQVLPDLAQRKLSWFTGFLILPQGKVTSYVHMGYASQFEGYRLLFIKDGSLSADRAFTAEEYGDYKALQFEAFKRSDKFRQMKKSPNEKELARANADNFLFIFDVEFAMETVIDYKDFRPNAVPR